jgi:orotidine-5'-phosphate decarboxylase
MVGPSMALVTPGVRPAGVAPNDQKRVTTPRRAIEGGADYLVVGRPIVESNDPRQAAEAIVAEIAAAQV